MLIIFIAVAYGTISMVYRIRTYSNNGSAYSKDPKLNGFKLYSKHKDAGYDLNNISTIINTRFNHQYVIVGNIDEAFMLGVTNKIIQTNLSTIIPVAAPASDLKYLVLVDNKNDRVQPNFGQKIYTSKSYDLYLLN
jgi:hypothetical protein